MMAGERGERGYLLIHAVTSFMAAAAFVQLALRAGAPRAEADNRDVLHALDRHRTVRIAQSLASGAITLAIWAVYAAVGLERYAFVIALALVVVTVANLIGSVPYWNRVLAYAQAAA